MAAPSDPFRIFDRQARRRHRDRAAPGLGEHEALLCEVAERLADRLSDIRRGFPLALDLGCHDGTLRRLLLGRGGIERLVQCDLSAAMAARARGPGDKAGSGVVVADEEALPFAAGAFDLVLSSFDLHWVNDLPGCLMQIRDLLKPDGLFLAALPGGQTLIELRQTLLAAEAATSGGASPRVSPFADAADLAGLLQRAGFALPVVDSDTLTLTYADPLQLMHELRGLGEANALLERRRSASRGKLFTRAAATYPRLADGRIAATFQIVYLTAWAPHSSQQRPLRPGSAEHRLARALGSTEHKAGDTAP
jgi:SAM-dependent methyltransferase